MAEDRQEFGEPEAKVRKLDDIHEHISEDTGEHHDINEDSSGSIANEHCLQDDRSEIHKADRSRIKGASYLGQEAVAASTSYFQYNTRYKWVRGQHSRRRESRTSARNVRNTYRYDINNKYSWNKSSIHLRYSYTARNKLKSRGTYNSGDIIYSRLRDQHNHYQGIPMTTKDRLMELDKKEPGDVICELLDGASKVKEWLKESAERSDMLPLMLSVLAKAFACRHMSYKTADLYRVTVETDFFNTIVLHLVDLQSQGGFENCKRNGLSKTIENVLTIIAEITSRNPSAIKHLSRIQLTLGKLIEDVKKVNGFMDDLSTPQRYSDLFNKISRASQKATGRTANGTETPPDDFRDIDIFPSEQDIHSTIEPFIRKNKTKGSYDDLDHYLDVQFRLLREDFIGPLREGIHQYMKSKFHRSKMRNRQTDLRIYENVRIVSPVCLAEGLCYKIQLDTTSLRKVNWRISKRLIFGSLLCLTTDNFRTFMIATVAGRNSKEVRQGCIEIRFEGCNLAINAKELFSRSFTIAETTAYFESYRHVLNGLQNFEEEDLPFQEYLIECRRKVKPPSYLDNDAEYDFGPLVNSETSQLDSGMFTHSSLYSRKCGHQHISNVLDLDTWPTANQLHLDGSQYSALQSALTKEFALIQGPPGTGKTYIGLKIAKILLHNKSVMSNSMLYRPKPMLVVCYTNHALDQFLEGIVKFHRNGVVRVGGQSRSDLLKEYTLQKMKYKYRSQGRLNRRFYYETMNDVARSINKINSAIDVYRSHVLKLEFLEPYMDDRLYQILSTSLHNQTGKNDAVVWRWLQVDSVLDRFEAHKDELEELSSGFHPEIPDIITITNSRQHLDEDAEKFEQDRLKYREEVVREIRASDVEVFFEDEIAPKGLSERDWQRQREINMRSNAIIRRYICCQDIMKDENEHFVEDPLNLSLDEKWKLYRLWVSRSCQKKYEEIIALENSYRETAARYKEAQLHDDCFVMKQADVIGMTTTCAARYLAILQDIRPNIVIVEEAAEVLEAHIVTTLSRGCQHLILIGDHKQLRPNPTVYELATKFNLNVSLFERMILNGVNFDSLELQHRMRPEISVLMRFIYDNLMDHESVREYENVKGVSKNIFMINHDHLENCIGDGTSHSNEFEADYVSALCKYLLQQGYRESQITILATYTSQMFLLRKKMPKDEYDGVTITVVDNYQGEENDFVILSLVRSNESGSVGFLKIENRICVALSRAKIGFYIIGNIDLITKHSQLWSKVATDMKKAGQIGDGLSLYCQNHPELVPFIAKTPIDFGNAPEGGCKKICESRLPCGHSCKKYCHPKDKEHEFYDCLEDCTRSCQNGHPCKKRCFEQCGECPTIVSKELTACGHTASMPCGRPESFYHCKEPCESSLECGHTCQNYCGSSHTLFCKIEVTKTFPCGHSAEVYCGSTDTAKCKCACKTVLMCGHPCSGSCTACCNGRFHQPCQKKCKRILVCGHACMSNCNLCLPCTKKCENKCIHSHCDRLCGEPCTPCMEKCAWQCKHKTCSRPCSEPCDREPCNKLCKKKLKCGHSCIGLCGEPCPIECRICDNEKVTNILFGKEDNPKACFILLQDCGHIIESKALDKYMKSNITEGNAIIQLKGCPICKTPIRKSYRYGNLINQTLADIEKVKLSVIGDRKSNRKLLKTLKEDSSGIDVDIKLPDNIGVLSEQHVVAFDNQCTLIKTFKKRMQIFISKTLYIPGQYTLNYCLTSRKEAVCSKTGTHLFGRYRNDTNFPYRYEDDQEVLEEMARRLTRRLVILTKQEIDDIKNELARCSLMGKILQLSHKIPDGKLDDARPDLELLQNYSRMEVIPDDDAIADATNRLQTLTEGMNIPEEEKQMILKTIGLSKGHWYKCPDGHVYAIGECGGATQEGVCPECNAKIGGKGHKLAEGNAVATEMDGATFGAYSEEANNLEVPWELHIGF